MSLWAIIPVKPLRRGKSRLAGVLTEDERTALNKFLLEHTLSVIKQVPEISQTLVISRDAAVLALARDYGARTLQEEGSPALNTALRRATILAKAYATSSILILPADIPLLNSADIQKIIHLASKPPAVVISPDRHHDGTNALLVSPTGLIDYAYGPESFQHHCERATQAGADLEICELDSTIGLDLDVPQDLELFRQVDKKAAEECIV